MPLQAADPQVDGRPGELDTASPQIADLNLIENRVLQAIRRQDSRTTIDQYPVGKLLEAGKTRFPGRRVCIKVEFVKAAGFGGSKQPSIQIQAAYSEGPLSGVFPAKVRVAVVMNMDEKHGAEVLCLVGQC